MQHVKQFELTLETGEKKIINESDLKRGSTLFFTEIGPGFGMEGVTALRLLPNERILDAGGIRAPKPQ